MRISAFPKCYLDDICVHKTMSIFDWIEKSKPLGAEGLEMFGDNIKSVISIQTEH